MMKRILVLAVVFGALSAVPAVAQSSPCATHADAVRDEPFVMAVVPAAGSRVKTGFVVGGCSRTFESKVGWRLTLRGGKELAKGNAKGGGADGPDVFSFIVEMKVDAPTLAYLEVYEPGGSGKGAVSRVIVPIVLTP
jgi:hypothetical protein